MSPRRPLIDNAFWAGFWGGGSAEYTAPFKAVTPTGITVRGRSCCPWHHSSPEGAVAHARKIEAQIRAGRYR